MVKKVIEFGKDLRSVRAFRPDPRPDAGRTDLKCLFPWLEGLTQTAQENSYLAFMCEALTSKETGLEGIPVGQRRSRAFGAAMHPTPRLSAHGGRPAGRVTPGFRAASQARHHRHDVAFMHHQIKLLDLNFGRWLARHMAPHLAAAALIKMFNALQLKAGEASPMGQIHVDLFQGTIRLKCSPETFLGL